MTQGKHSSSYRYFKHLKQGSYSTIAFSENARMIKRDELGTSSCFQDSQTDGVIWGLSLIGATVFVATSKVSLLLHFIEDKRWYGDFMTFAVTLAMGTMFAVTIFQFIPESLHFLHVQVELLILSKSKESQDLQRLL